MHSKDKFKDDIYLKIITSICIVIKMDFKVLLIKILNKVQMFNPNHYFLPKYYK